MKIETKMIKKKKKLLYLMDEEETKESDKEWKKADKIEAEEFEIKKVKNEKEKN